MKFNIVHLIRGAWRRRFGRYIPFMLAAHVVNFRHNMRAGLHGDPYPSEDELIKEVAEVKRRHFDRWKDGY